MNAIQRIFRRTGYLLLVLLLAVTGMAGSGRQTHAAAAAAASAPSYVYFVSDEALYRVSADGRETLKLTDHFEGKGLTSTGKYLYFYYENAMGIQRISMVNPDTAVTNFLEDRYILYYLFDGPYLYFLDDTGHIYRTWADAGEDPQLTLIADNADMSFKAFDVRNGRLYYNALRNSTERWVASRPRDGSGAIQWIASGVVPKSWFFHAYHTTNRLVVDTAPEETEYSLNSMVLYTLPLSGGTPKAANAGNPLKSNDVNSGTWSGQFFLFNKGIKLDAEGEDFNYNTGKGYLMDKNGKILQLSQNSVTSISEIAGNKLVYADAKGKAYISTLANGKVISTRPLPLTNVKDIRTVKNGTALTTILFTTTDAYVLNSNSTLTKMSGVDSDYAVLADHIPGLYYINAPDNNALYRFSNDGKIKTKLFPGPVSYIALVSGK